jgi:hypothetical protein
LTPPPAGRSVRRPQKRRGQISPPTPFAEKRSTIRLKKSLTNRCWHCRAGLLVIVLAKELFGMDCPWEFFMVFLNSRR